MELLKKFCKCGKELKARAERHIGKCPECELA